MENRTAIIIVSHNSKEITDTLCDSIVRNTKAKSDLYVIETGSDLNKISRYTSLWSSEGIRMTRAFNLGIQFALIKESSLDVNYDSFWLVVNDTILDEIDTLTPLVTFMRQNKDCAEIHPYVKNSPSIYQQKAGIIVSNARKTSFTEIVCPLFSREIINKYILDNRYFYGWGLDYEIPYLIYRSGKRIYISNEVGVTHNAGTTTRIGGDGDFKTIPDQFKASRDNMMETLIWKWGPKWGDLFLQAIPPDVPKEPFIHWVTKIGENYAL